MKSAITSLIFAILSLVFATLMVTSDNHVTFSLMFLTCAIISYLFYYVEFIATTQKRKENLLSLAIIIANLTIFIGTYPIFY